MYQLCENAINLYHLYVPHIYVPNVCSIYIYAQYVCSINNYVPCIHDIYMCYAYECLCICMWHMWNWNMFVLCVIFMSIQAPFVCAPFVNMAHVSTHKDNTCSTYKTYEMAIMIVHIIICYKQFDDQWILCATHRWLNPNIFGLYETILNLDVTMWFTLHSCGILIWILWCNKDNAKYVKLNILLIWFNWMEIKYKQICEIY